MSRKARIEITSELIVDRLPLPAGSKIVDVHMIDHGHGHHVVFYVEHESLPEVALGDPVPRRQLLCELITTRFGGEY